MTQARKRGWSRVSFGDAVRLCRERSSDPVDAGFERYIGLEHLDPGDLKIRRWGSTADGTTFTSVFRAGHVLFGKRRAYQRKVAVADFDGVCSSDIYVLESADPKTLLPELLPFICQTDRFFAHAVGTSAGSLSPRTNWESLADYEFALPPLDEQRRIVEARGAIERVVQRLQTVYQASENIQHSFAGSNIMEPTSGAGIPLCRIASVDIETVQLDNSKIYCSAGVLNAGQGLFSRPPLSAETTHYRQMNRLRTDQIVMRKLTAWEGAIAVVPAAFDGFVVSSEFPTMTMDKSNVDPSYLAWVFRQAWFWRRMRAECKGTAVRRARLQPSDLLDISIILPPIERQREVTSQLHGIASQINEIKQRLRNAKEMGQRLLAECLETESIRE